MRKIKHDPTKSRRIVPKNNPKLNIDIIPSRKYINGGLVSNSIVNFQDKIFSTISETTFEDKYTLNLVWKNNLSAEILSFNMSNDTATISKNSTNYSLDKITNSLSSFSQVNIVTSAGVFFSKLLSFYRATRPTMYIWEGYKSGTLSKSIYDSFINIFNNRPTFPSGNINYDSNSWTGLSLSDIRIINTSQDKQNYITNNRSDPTAANFIYIDKSVFPNKLLKWIPLWNNYFTELRANDLYIIQNDGRWNPPTNNIDDSLDSGEVKYRLNPFFYGKNLDFSGVTVFCSTGDGAARRTKTGTLVTKRHMVHVGHAGYTPAVNSVVRFVSKNGTLVEKTIIGRYTNYIDGYWSNGKFFEGSGTDFGITLLDSDVPNDVTVYKLLPDNVNNYMPPTFEQSDTQASNVYIKNSSNNYIQIKFRLGYGLFTHFFNQNKTVQPTTKLTETRIETWDQNLAFKNSSIIEDYFSYFLQSIIANLPISIDHGRIPGDSGSPQFFSLNNTELVLAALNSGSLQSLTTINNIITNHLFVPGYQAEAIDCSNFEFFS